MKTLIVGCSFCSTLGEQRPEQWQLHPDVTVASTSGTGNQAIAARVLYECSQNTYNRVIVIWTGINRLDLIVPRTLHETYPGAQEGSPGYSYYTPLKSEVWYHSGGFGAGWYWDDRCPTDIKQYFKTQYLTATPQYMSDITLSSIANTQNLLTVSNINYDMSFIYDIHRDYRTDKSRRLENVLGRLVSDSPYYDLVNWNKIKTKNTAYEWATQNPSRLESDTFHPTRNAMREWIDLTFGLDIAVQFCYTNAWIV